MAEKSVQEASDIIENAWQKREKKKEHDFKFDIVDFEWFIMLKEEQGS